MSGDQGGRTIIRHATQVINESPLAQLKRHARPIEQAADILTSLKTATPTDLVLAEKALYEADQAIKRARRAISAARMALSGSYRNEKPPEGGNPGG